MSRRLKKEIHNALASHDWQDVEDVLCKYRGKDIIHHLFAALCSVEGWKKWHAVKAFGVVVPKIRRDNPETARIVMRRFLWSLNNESGGIGWGAPEAMAEIMANDDILFTEYSHMLISYMWEDGPELLQDGNFLELPMLQRGLLWGIARLLAARGKEMERLLEVHDLTKYIQSSDPTVCGLALFCLLHTGFSIETEVDRSFIKEDHIFQIFWQDSFMEKTIGEILSKMVNQSL